MTSVIVGKGILNAPHDPGAKSKVVVGDNFVLRRDRAVSVGRPRRHIGAPQSNALPMTIGLVLRNKRKLSCARKLCAMLAARKELHELRSKESTGNVKILTRNPGDSIICLIIRKDATFAFLFFVNISG